MMINNKKAFLKRHLIINIWLVCRWFVVYGYALLVNIPEDIPDVNLFTLFIFILTMFPVSWFGMMAIGYLYLIPYIIYYLYVIVRVITNIRNIEKRDTKYIVFISILGVTVLIMNIVLIGVFRSGW